MAHYRRCLEQASFESHDSLVDRVGIQATGEISKLGWSLPWSAKIQPEWRR
jgi:hypothetical protein